MDIVKIIEAVRQSNYYGGGEFIELAKGKNELIATWREMIQKIKRLLK